MSTDTLPWSAEPPALPRTDDAVTVIDQLLRARHKLLARLDNPAEHLTIMRAALLATLLSGFAFGAALGLHRGGLQLVYAAVKLPLVLLLTAALATPALTALQHAVGARFNPRRDVALVLSSLALASLVIAATSPLVVLAALLELDYHLTILLVVACCCLGGAFGMSLLARGLAANTDANRFVLLVSLATFMVVGAQLSWVLRPFLVRPRAEIAFLRPVESTFGESVMTSLRSSAGLYSRASAPLAAEEP